MFLELDVHDFESFRKKKDPFILDVRTYFEFSEDHIEDAKNIPIQFLGGHLDEIPDDRTLLIYCMHGVRSGRAAAFLAAKGYEDVHHLAQGLEGLRGLE